MAWIITLALFLWVGSLFAKRADKAADKQFLKGEQNLKKEEPFFENFYVVYWYFYQQMEKQALDKWAERYQKKKLKEWEGEEEDREESDPFWHPNRETWFNFQKQTFGESADQRAAQVAYAQMMEHGCKMLMPNPDEQKKRQHGFEYVEVTKHSSVNIDEAARYLNIWAFHKMPVVWEYFDFKFASNVTDPWVISLMPEFDDFGVAHYQVGRYTYTRKGTPSDYDAQVQQVRRQSQKPMKPYKHHATKDVFTYHT